MPSLSMDATARHDGRREAGSHCVAKRIEAFPKTRPLFSLQQVTQSFWTLIAEDTGCGQRGGEVGVAFIRPCPKWVVTSREPVPFFSSVSHCNYNYIMLNNKKAPVITCDNNVLQMDPPPLTSQWFGPMLFPNSFVNSKQSTRPRSVLLPISTIKHIHQPAWCLLYLCRYTS